jgi:ribosome biogenesis GTPase
LKNLLTVGDFVLFEPKDHSEGFIIEVLERTSVLSRADNLSRRKEQLIAANIDQVLITTSVVSPAFKANLVDRYIIAAQKGGMKPIIVINKIDQLENVDDVSIAAERELVHLFIEIYTQLGYQVIPVSCITQEGIAALKETMRSKASVFSGQSGVGKSSLINLMTGLELPTGEIVSKTQKGAHTTTSAQLIPLEEGGWCIDTPGIKSFGLWNLQTEEIQQFYHEIKAAGAQCRYPNCTHIHEPDCAVVSAVQAGTISALRYESYCSLLTSIEKPHRLR